MLNALFSIIFTYIEKNDLFSALTAILYEKKAILVGKNITITFYTCSTLW